MRTITIPAAAFAAVAIFTVSANAEELAGVGNFHKVNATVYRGAQPSKAGFENLAKAGVKTVIDLRRVNEHDTAAERRIVEGLGMRYVNIPMNGVVAPTDSQVSQVLAILDGPSTGPAFVHCKRGADRTGGVIACYRVQHDGWENKKALHEAKANGMSWTQFGVKSYVMAYRPGAVTNAPVSAPKLPAAAAALTPAGAQ